MRIAVWHNLPSGGAKRALVDHVDGLVRRGHQIEVWTNPEAARFSPAFETDPPLHVVDLDIASQLRGGALPPWPIARQRLRAMDRHLEAVGDAVNKGGFDICYAAACRFLRTVDLGSRLDIPSVLYLGEPYRWLYEAMPVLPWALEPRRHDESFAQWLRRRARDVITTPGLRRLVSAEVQAARGWDRILVNSAYSRESVLRAYGIDATVCYLGVDPTRLAVPAASRVEGDFIVGLGALVEEKGVDRAIRAIARLPVPRPTLVWVANVASPTYRARIDLLARDLGVTFDLKLAISDSELAELLNTARLLIYTPRLEPFGLAVIEASAVGLPVVGVAEAGVRESIVDGVNGLLAWTDDDLPAAIARVLDDDELRRHLSDGARKLVAERWTMDAALDRLESQLVAVRTR